MLFSRFLRNNLKVECLRRSKALLAVQRFQGSKVPCLRRSTVVGRPWFKGSNGPSMPAAFQGCAVQKLFKGSRALRAVQMPSAFKSEHSGDPDRSVGRHCVPFQGSRVVGVVDVVKVVWVVSIVRVGSERQWVDSCN